MDNRFDYMAQKVIRFISPSIHLFSLSLVNI